MDSAQKGNVVIGTTAQVLINGFTLARCKMVFLVFLHRLVKRKLKKICILLKVSLFTKI